MGKKVQKKKKTQVAKIRNERRNITTDFTARKRIMRVWIAIRMCMYTNALDNLVC